MSVEDVDFTNCGEDFGKFVTRIVSELVVAKRRIRVLEEEVATGKGHWMVLQLVDADYEIAKCRIRDLEGELEAAERALVTLRAYGKP